MSRPTSNFAHSRLRRWRRFLSPAFCGCALVMLACVIATGVSAATVTTLDGQTIEGDVAAFSAEQITLNAADGARRFSNSQMLEIRWSKDQLGDPASPFVQFIDGTRTTYVDFAVDGRTVTLKGQRFGDLATFSRDKLRLVELQRAPSALSPLLEAIEQKEVAGDVLVISKRDGQSLDYLAGVVGDVTSEHVAFEWDAEKVPVKRTKIAAILFYQGQPPALPDAICQLDLVDGSRIAVRALQLDGDQLAVTTPAGVELAIPLDQLSRADFSLGKLIYLSDLKPAHVVWTPRVALPAAAATIAAFGQPRYNQSFTGSALALLWKDDVARSRRDVRTYNKGLALRSRTELTYRIPAGMQRFVSIAGIDPETSAQGNVLLQIRGDDHVLWEGPVIGGERPQEIDVQLGAARRLHLTVDYGENLDYGDRLHLVEARFTK